VPNEPATRLPADEVPAIQKIVSVLWPSFLTAAAATIIFFTLFDPAELGRLLGLELSRVAGYTGGFFGFWIISSISSSLTCQFRRPCHKVQPTEESNDVE